MFPVEYVGRGKTQGENIQQIKPSFTGFHSNWQVHTHRRYMIKKTVAKLKKKIAEDVFENLSKNSVLHVYRCAETALSAYHLGKPLMIVRLKNNCFGVLHSHKKIGSLMSLNLWEFLLTFGGLVLNSILMTTKKFRIQ